MSQQEKTVISAKPEQAQYLIEPLARHMYHLFVNGQFVSSVADPGVAYDWYKEQHAAGSTCTVFAGQEPAFYCSSKPE